jgi:DNA-binding transcriptional ArsR family regulator
MTDTEALGRTVEPWDECVHALKGLAHPIRLAALIALGRGELSPSQFARSRGEPVSNVSYHFRLLAEIGLIELVRTRPVRGSLEHIYRRAEKAADWIALVSRIVR